MERNWTKTICNVFFNHVLSRRSKLKSQIHAQKWQFKTKLITLFRCYAHWSDSFHQMILVLTSVGDTVSLVRTCKVDTWIVHRNKDRISGRYPPRMLYRQGNSECDRQGVKFPDDLDSLWPRPPGQSRRQSTQTFNRLTFRDLGEERVVLGCLPRIKSVLVSRKTTRDRCMKTASKDPEKRWGALQRKINTTKP